MNTILEFSDPELGLIYDYKFTKGILEGCTIQFEDDRGLNK